MRTGQPFSPIVPPFGVRISRVVADVEAPGGKSGKVYTRGKAMANNPQELAQDAAYQGHTSRLTEFWFLPKLALGLNTDDDDDYYYILFIIIIGGILVLYIYIYI